MGFQKAFLSNTAKKILKQKEGRFIQESNSYQSLDTEDDTLYKQGELFIERCIRQVSKDTEHSEQLKMGKIDGSEFSKMEMQIFKFYNREYEKKKYKVEQNKGLLLNRRRNAVCEHSMEERIGLGLCLQRHQHNEYMLDYEM